MLSDEELTEIKALGLSPEVEEAIIVSEHRHRRLLCANARNLGTGGVEATAPASEDQSDELLKTVSGSRRRPARDTDLIPWNVQFSE